MRYFIFVIFGLTSMLAFSSKAYAGYNCQVEIKFYYGTKNNGSWTSANKQLFNSSFNSSGISNWRGGLHTKTKKCAKTAFYQTFPNHLREVATTKLWSDLNLNLETKKALCDGSKPSLPTGIYAPGWARGTRHQTIITKAKRINGNGYKEFTDHVFIPENWCKTVDAEVEAATQAQEQQDAYNAACLTCLYTWDGKYHSCATKMGFDYSELALPMASANSVNEKACKARSDYIRAHEPDKSTRPYNVTRPNILTPIVRPNTGTVNPQTGGSVSIKRKTK